MKETLKKLTTIGTAAALSLAVNNVKAYEAPNVSELNLDAHTRTQEVQIKVPEPKSRTFENCDVVVNKSYGTATFYDQNETALVAEQVTGREGSETPDGVYNVTDIYTGTQINRVNKKTGQPSVLKTPIFANIRSTTNSSDNLGMYAGNEDKDTGGDVKFLGKEGAKIMKGVELKLKNKEKVTVCVTPNVHPR
jgi:hypothetical protein